MRDLVYFLVFDGFADWEAALACAEIEKSGRFSVVTAGFSRDPVQSMGGLRILPEIALEEIETERARLLLLPGGTMWELGEQPEVTALLRRLHDSGAAVAGMCGATLALARAGLLAGRRHTSNFRGYLERHVPGYGDEKDYVDAPAVTDGDVITASGMGGVELAFELIRLLGLYEEREREVWLTIFRDKVVPEVVA